MSSTVNQLRVVLYMYYQSIAIPRGSNCRL